MSYSENNTFEKILDRALSNDLLVNVDKRVGSIAYDSLAPLCMELAEAYALMDIMEEQTYLMTASGKNLDRRVYDYGIARGQATKALRIGSFKKNKVDENGKTIVDENGNPVLIGMSIPEGSRFAVPNDDTTFEYVGRTEGYDILQCEQTGTKGNSHIGIILPLTPISGLTEAKIVSTYIPGEDEETDEDLRERAKNHLNYIPYGGNIADYIQKVNTLDGVGQTKVFPAWQYHGSVLLSVVDPSFNPITPEFARVLKEQIDPEEESGEGVGFAPIGHYVTVTTPVKMFIDVSMNLEIEVDTDAGEVYEQIVSILEDYFLSERKKFSQYNRLTIYRSRIMERILNGIPRVINITNLLLNETDADITYTDEGQIGMQYLPYVGTVTVDGNTGGGE